jgi:hypothetical protein
LIPVFAGDGCRVILEYSPECRVTPSNEHESLMVIC